MHNQSKNPLLFSIILITFLSITSFSFVLLDSDNQEKMDKEGNVLGTEENLVVTAFLPYYISVTVKPEDRLPVLNNNEVEILVQINSFNSPVTTIEETLITDIAGFTDLTPVDPSTFVAGPYDIYVKGSSHLTTKFPNRTIGPVAISDHDLTFEDLRAGDTHPVSDDYINSLDIAYILNNFGTTDLQADLNRDGDVDETDIAILLDHLYKIGDE
jgi:hypothetical protein